MQDEQKFGLSFEELATRETVYRENLLEITLFLLLAQEVVWVKRWPFFLRGLVRMLQYVVVKRRN